MAEDSFDATSERALRYVKQLGEWDHRVLLVTGERGTARAALFQLLSSHVAPGSRAARVNGAAHRSHADIWLAIAHGLGVEVSPSAEQPDIAAKILAHSRGLAEGGHLDVVLVDNADHLPDNVIESLLAVMEKSLPFDGLRLVLFGDEPFVEGFGLMIAAFAPEVGWHHTQVTAETLAAVERNLTRRATRTDSDADREPKVDAEVNALGPTAASLSSRRVPWIHLGLAAVITLVLLAVSLDLDWMFPDDEGVGDIPTPLEALHARGAEAEGDVETVTEPSSAAEAQTIPLEPQIVESERISTPEKRMDSLSSEPAEREIVQSDVADTDASPRAAETPPEDAPPKPSEPTGARAAQAAGSSPAVVQATERELVETPDRGPEWIMRQRPDAFVLQLFGVSSRERLARFLEAQAPEEPFAYFETERGGSPWFVVLYGSYRDRESASNAVAKLPASAGDAPWIRTFGDVQKDVAASR